MLIGSLAMLWGYLRSWLKGLPRYDDLKFRRFLRSYQHACLRMGKRTATARVDAEGARFGMPATPSIRLCCNQRNSRAALIGLESTSFHINYEPGHGVAGHLYLGVTDPIIQLAIPGTMGKMKVTYEREKRSW